MRNFLGEDAQPIVGPSPGEHPVRGIHQAMIDRLPLCKKNNETCEPNEVRHADVNVGREAPNRS